MIFTCPVPAAVARIIAKPPAATSAADEYLSAYLKSGL
jgi:hypothetical protein